MKRLTGSAGATLYLAGIIAGSMVGFSSHALADSVPMNETEYREWMKSPEYITSNALNTLKWDDFEALAARLATSDERNQDGEDRWDMILWMIRDYLQRAGQDGDYQWRTRFEEYSKSMPKSPFAPLMPVLQLQSMAWRARGDGFASTVPPEAWQLFHDRLNQAWKLLVQAKPLSSRLQPWYRLSIEVAVALDCPRAQVVALVNEGITKFPDDDALYRAAMRQYAPRWGGNYVAADEFIQAQVSAKTNQRGEERYARMYWYLDAAGGGEDAFFDESRVRWTRLRDGFGLLIKRYPESKKLPSVLAAFACRAGDVDTYRRLRNGLDYSEFNAATPQGMSVETCDEKFIAHL